MKVFTFFGAEDSEDADAFLFFKVARSTALVLFASDAEGRLMVVIFAGGAEEIGAISSGATDEVALTCSVSSGAVADASTGLACSSGTTLEVALAVSSVAGISSTALVLLESSAA